MKLEDQDNFSAWWKSLPSESIKTATERSPRDYARMGYAAALENVDSIEPEDDNLPWWFWAVLPFGLIVLTICLVIGMRIGIEIGFWLLGPMP